MLQQQLLLLLLQHHSHHHHQQQPQQAANDKQQQQQQQQKAINCTAEKNISQQEPSATQSCHIDVADTDIDAHGIARSPSETL